MKYTFTITKAASTPDITKPFDSSDWQNANAIVLKNRRPETGEYHPHVEFRLQYDDKGFYGLYEATDRAIRCVQETFNSSVCNDSCLEFFIQPAGDHGYINFEINACGVMLAMHILDPERTAHGFKDYRYLTAGEVSGMKIFHTLPDRLESEITTETTYRLGWFIPFDLFKQVMGIEAPETGDIWKGNVFKCGDETSLPHHISWTELGELNFHTPQYFGEMIFG